MAHQAALQSERELSSRLETMRVTHAAELQNLQLAHEQILSAKLATATEMIAKKEAEMAAIIAR